MEVEGGTNQKRGKGKDNTTVEIARGKGEGPWKCRKVTELWASVCFKNSTEGKRKDTYTQREALKRGKNGHRKRKHLIVAKPECEAESLCAAAKGGFKKKSSRGETSGVTKCSSASAHTRDRKHRGEIICWKR